jgi:hypothetical protein
MALNLPPGPAPLPPGHQPGSSWPPALGALRPVGLRPLTKTPGRESLPR